MKSAEDELGSRVSNPLRHGVGLRPVCQPIQFQQDDTAQREALANDHFAEIAVLRDQNAVVGIRRIQNIVIRRARSRLGNGNHVMTFVAKALDHKAGDIFIREKAHQSAARTVSCCM
jgi:hypothetical protein